MFEKESKEYAIGLTYPKFQDKQIANIVLRDVEGGFQKGAEFGYNNANEWHFVKDGDLPKISGRYLVYVGGGEKGVYPLDFETEANDFGYWCLQFGENLGVSDTVFETVTERNEDKVIAWKEIVLPKESE